MRGPHPLAGHGVSRLLDMIRHSPRRSLPLLINALVITRWQENCLPHGGMIDRRRLSGGNAGVAFIVSPHAGSLNDSPLVSTAQAMRAFLAAMATTAFQYPRRSRSAIAQRLSESVLHDAALSTALAPSTSRLRS